MHMELDLKNGHFCRTSVTIPLFNIPTSTDLEAQLKGARLDARWVDMQAGFKLAIGMIYTERIGPHLDVFKDFDTHGMFSRHVLKLTKKDTRQVYAARRLVGSLRRHPPFLAAAEDDLRIAAFLYQAYWDDRVMMISPMVEGGHLFYYLQQERTFGLERSRIYIAELILIFESMSSHEFIQQDLRPLAIKLDCRGHVMYCDFDLYQSGSAMKPDMPISWQENRYLAPEAFTQLESNNSTGKIVILASSFNLQHH
jgi:serine/threonine protein kinase